MSKKKHGWVIEMNNNHPLGWFGFYSDGMEYVVIKLRDAKVYDTRHKARHMADSDEVVRKVTLSKRVVPNKIIPGR